MQGPDNSIVQVLPAILPPLGQAPITGHRRSQAPAQASQAFPAASTSAPVEGYLLHTLQQQQLQQQQQPQQQQLWDSEIQPCVDEMAAQGDAQRVAWRRTCSSSTSAGGGPPAAASGVYGTPPSSRPMGIPIPSTSSSIGGREGRMYRVVVSPSPSTAGNTPLSSTVAATQPDDTTRVMVVLDRGAQDPPLPGHTSSVPARGFLGSLFQRNSRGQTPEGSTHGGDLLPHHFRPSPGAEAVLGASSLEANSVLGKACGSLRRQGHSTSHNTSRLSGGGHGPLTPRGTHTGTTEGPAGSSRTSNPGIRAFASVDNLSALQAGQWSQPPLPSPTAQVHSPRTAKLRYPQIAHLLHSQSMGGTQQPTAAHMGRISAAHHGNAAAAGGSGQAGLAGVVGAGGTAGGGRRAAPGSSAGAAQQQYPDASTPAGAHHQHRQLIKHASFAAYSLPAHSSALYSNMPQRMSRSSSLLALLQYESGDPSMCAADIAVLSSSLPTNFAQPSHSTLKRVNSMTSPTAARALSRHGSSSAINQLGRAGSLGSSTADGGSARASRGVDLPPAPPICLICLEMLTPEDFASGEAMQLECLCKGEVAMRHRACAIEWSNVKGNLLCDICKHPINNLPEIDPAIVAAREAARRRRQPAFAVTQQPTTADYIFDAIRVTWVTIICCILFVDGLSVSKTFLIGASVGMAYMWLSFLLQLLFNRWRHRRRQVLLQRQQQRQQEQQGLQQEEGPDAGAVQQLVPNPSGSSDSLMVPLLIPGQDGELPV